jgi:hypothetical protein
MTNGVVLAGLTLPNPVLVVLAFKYPGAMMFSTPDVFVVSAQYRVDPLELVVAAPRKVADCGITSLPN